MKRFEKDLQEVCAHFELEHNTQISEILMDNIMEAMGFIHLNNNSDVESVQIMCGEPSLKSGASPERM